MTKNQEALNYVDHLSYISENPPSDKYFLIGESNYLKNLIKVKVKKKLSESGDFETHTLFGDEFNIDEFSELLDQSSFFFSKKLINLKRASLISKANLKKISEAKLFSRNLTDIQLIFEDDVTPEALDREFYKVFSSFTILSDCSISKSQLISWISARFRAYSMEVPKDIPKNIAEITGDDVDYSMQIVERLYLLSPNDDKEWRDALNYFPKEHKSVIFALSDAMLSKNKGEAMKILSNLIEEGESFEGILYYLINHYSFLCEVKLVSIKHSTKKEVFDILKDKNPFRVEKAYSQVKKVSFNRLSSALSSLIKIEKDFKSGHLSDISNVIPLLIGGSK
jgi:DNA polymerase III delta subunit